MNIVLLGPPGAGKGTLAGNLKDDYSLSHISTGDILRAEMKKESALGLEAKSFVESGGLVPDELVTRLIEAKCQEDNGATKGFMFDGFPRTVTQATDLDVVLEKMGQAIDVAIYMEASADIVVQRLTGRRVCRQCGALYHVVNKPSKVEGVCDECSGELYQRADDNEETIKNRMSVYVENTKPIIDFYKSQGKLKQVNADNGAQDVCEKTNQILNG